MSGEDPPPGEVAAIVGALRAGSTTAGAVAAEHLARAAGAARLNLFTLLDPAAARARAAALDARGASGPLAGVPVAVKDVIDQEGAVTTAGSSFLRLEPERSSPVVDRLEDAGAVVLGRTGLHEFAFGFSSENPWWGAVRNPWDPETAAGGSSGGSAAAVAAGVAPIGIGTDTGGSVRVPAALCGVMGLKVSHGRIPLSGVFPLAASLDTVGPLGRSVADLAAAYSVMAGVDRADPWSAPQPVAVPEGPYPLEDLRVGIPLPWTDRPLDRVTAAGFAAALERLTAAGATVIRIDAPELVPDRAMHTALGAEVAAVHRRWFTEHPDRYGSDVAARLARAVAVSTDDLVDALRWRSGVRHRAAAIFGHVDVLITPTTAVHRKTIGRDEVETDAGPEPYRRALSWFTALVNHLGVPAIALPIDAPGSPPPSMQIIGPMWSEDRLLGIAEALSRAGMLSTSRPGNGAPQGSALR